MLVAEEDQATGGTQKRVLSDSSLLKRNVVANYLGQGWRALMGIAFVPIYVRYLGVESYGVIGLFAILQAWLELLDLGMRPTLAREMARFTAGAHDSNSIRALLRAAELMALGIAVVVSLGVWATAKWIATEWLTSRNLPVPELTRAISLMGVVIGLRFIESMYVSCLVGLQRQQLESVVTSSLATVRGLGVLAVLAFIAPSVRAYFAWQAMISVLTVLIFASVVHRVLPSGSKPKRFSLSPLLSIWRFAAGMSVISVLALLLTQTDKMLMSRLLPLQEFGYYALAGVVTNGLVMVTAPIYAAFFPRLAELVARNDSVTLSAVYHKGCQLVAALTGSASAILIMFAPRIVLLWTRNPSLTDRVAPLVQVLTVGTLLNALMGMPGQLQLANGWTSLIVRINTAAVCLLIPFLFWVVPTYGALGGAWGWAALNASYFVVVISLMHQRLLPRDKWVWYREDVAYPIGAAAIVAMLFYLMLPASGEKLPQIAALMTASLAALGASLLAAPLLRQHLATYVGGGRTSK